MRQTITEAYGVKLGRGKPVKPFGSLEDAIDFINTGMKNRDSETFVLYNDNKEMIWLDWYRDENNNSLGYIIARQDDKNTVEFDKQKGLIIKTTVEDDKELRGIVVKEAGRMKYINEASKLAKFRFVNETSKPSYIDFDEGCVHYNQQDQLNDAIESLVKQLRSKTESLDTEEEPEQLDEIFGFGKKSNKKRYIVGVVADSSRSVYTANLCDFLEEELRKVAEDVKPYRGPRYFPYHMLCTFEFVCEEHEFERVKRTILNKIHASDFTITREYSVDADRLVADLIKWGSLGTIRESVEDTALAESWYLQEWK
jgi:hypothetical protein